LATELPEDKELLIIDDCSDDPATQKYLFTNETVTLDAPFSYPDYDKWQKMVGRIKRPISQLKGIDGQVEIVQPDSKKGVRGGIFWCINYMMNRYPDAPGIIIIEADAVFHAKWYEAVVKAYEATLNGKGPNGEQLGLLTCYDRKGKFRKNTPDMGHCWRGVTKKRPGLWNCAGGIGGVMYLVTRGLYTAAKPHFTKSYNPNQRSGDTALQAVCGEANHTIATTVPSFCQHIGTVSLAWPMKGWRHAQNFKKPFAFETRDEEGIASSEGWA
jgi:hypothetical protein